MDKHVCISFNYLASHMKMIQICFKTWVIFAKILKYTIFQSKIAARYSSWMFYIEKYAIVDTKSKWVDTKFHIKYEINSSSGDDGHSCFTSCGCLLGVLCSLGNRQLMCSLCHKYFAGEVTCVDYNTLYEYRLYFSLSISNTLWW